MERAFVVIKGNLKIQNTPSHAIAFVDQVSTMKKGGFMKRANKARRYWEIVL